MADQRKPGGISWTDETWNPIRGCSRVSEGCRNCYAERMAARFSGAGQPYEGLARMTPDGPRWTGKVRLVPDKLEEPLRWRKPRRVFVNSMSDLFHEDMPENFILDIFAVMAEAKQHTFQVLTKRPERMTEVLSSPTVANDVWVRTTTGVSASPAAWPLPNVWLGVSVEDQATADQRIPLLLRTPAAVRFLSCEPLLGPIDLSRWMTSACDEFWPDQGHPTDCPTQNLHWVIVGGESGPGARPMHPDWARAIRDQCQAAGVPFFFKQWGQFRPLGRAWWPADGKLVFVRSDGGIDERPRVGVYYAEMQSVGKKAAGAILDGREWRKFPRL